MYKPFVEPIFVTRPLIPDSSAINKKINEVINSKWLTNNGTQLKKLELQLKNYLNIDNISLFNNGTMALLLGLKALELKGEVITTPFTFPATVEALDWNGLTPVFCDIEKETLNINPHKIEELITEKTTAILGVHVFGNPCDINRIQQIADKYRLKVIYDGAHTFGSVIEEQPISKFGDMTMFSFHATKLFNTIEGGALAFRDPKLLEKLALLKNFGIDGPEKVILSGLNAKMNEIQAVFGLETLKIIDEERKKREKIRRLYNELLSNIEGIRIITNHEGKASSYQYFVIEINLEKYGYSRDELHEELKRYNIYTRKYFYPLCSDFAWYNHLESAHPYNLSQAQQSVTQVLSMPFYGDLSLESVEKICNIIKYISLNRVIIK